MLRFALAVAALAALLLPALAAAQDSLPPSPRRGVRVFLDCQQMHCDGDYFRTEIGFVDYVRNRQDADVQILVTRQRTGGGGNEYTANFIGIGRYTGRQDTLHFYTRQDATDDVIRRGLARTFKVGLLRYVAGTAAIEGIHVVYTPPTGAAAAPPPSRDPWNFWVFRVRASSYFHGESSSHSLNLSGSVSANRTTEQWKLDLSARGNYSEDRYQLDSVTNVTSTSKDFRTSGLAVRSVGTHWAVGAVASAGRSTYSNQALALRFAPGIEYDFYPYDESTRRQLTLRYNVGINRFRYDEQTIFFKTGETLFDESLTLSLDTRQPWGSASFQLQGAHYLDDFSQNRVQLDAEMDVRLFKGLSASFNASVSRVRDQRYLPAGGATPEEVLLQRRALATSYRYYGSVGLSYSFGSIFNNVVNPRFDGPGN